MTNEPGDAIPDPLTPREHVIRAIHRYADYLTAHDDVPYPRAISAYTFLSSDDVPVESERVAAVMRWADAQGVKPSETLTAVNAALPITVGPYVTITHLFGAYLDLEQRRRYVVEQRRRYVVEGGGDDA
jgi:hypothetical protein